MRHNLFLSALLLGGTILMTGCGSSSGSSTDSVIQEIVDNIDENTTDALNSLGDEATQLSVDMLKGKTFYTYGLNRDGTRTENRFVIEFNADASGFNVHNFPDSSDSFSVDGDNAVIDGKMQWSVAGGSTFDIVAVEILPDGSFIVMSDDPDHYDPYPQLFSAAELADKGQAVFDTFTASQSLDKGMMTANAWYGISWSYDNDDAPVVQCDAMFLFGGDNSLSYAYVENGAIITKVNAGTFVVSDNMLEMDFTEGEARHSTLDPLLLSENELLWKNQMTFFKYRTDAVAFVELMGGGAGCYDIFPPQQ